MYICYTCSTAFVESVWVFVRVNIRFDVIMAVEMKIKICEE